MIFFIYLYVVFSIGFAQDQLLVQPLLAESEYSSRNIDGYCNGEDDRDCEDSEEEDEAREKAREEEEDRARRAKKKREKEKEELEKAKERAIERRKKRHSTAG